MSTAAAVVKAPLLYNMQHLVSSAMEMPVDFRYTFRLCASILFVITRTGHAALSGDNDRAIHGDQLGWPFSSESQEKALSIRLTLKEGGQIIAALKTALRRLAAVALGTPTLDVSTLVFCTTSNNSSISCIRRRESLHAQTDAMIEVIKAYAIGGGVWPGTGPRVVRPTTIVGCDKALLVQRVLLHLRDGGADGQAVLRALLGEHRRWTLSESTSSSACTKPLSCTPTAAIVPAPCRSEEASTPMGSNTMAEKFATTSRVDMLCMYGGEATCNFAGATSRPLTNIKPAQQQCGIMPRPQAATSSQKETCEGSAGRKQSRGGIAVGSLAKLVEESPRRAGNSPPRDAAEADSSSALVASPAGQRRMHRLDTNNTTHTTTNPNTKPNTTNTNNTNTNNTNTPVNGSTSVQSYPKRPRWFHLPWSKVVAGDPNRHINDAKGRSMSLLNDIPPTAAAAGESPRHASVTPYPFPTASAHGQSTTSTVTGRSRVMASSASCGGSPQGTYASSASSPRSGASATLDPYPVGSTSPSRERLLAARKLVHSGKEEEEEEKEGKSTVAAAATSSERSAAVAPSRKASATPPSNATAVAAAAVTSSDGLPPSSASPRGRRRAPSYPRGRPGSPGRASPPPNVAYSPPSSGSPSRSPAPTRGNGAVPSSPRRSYSKVSKESLAVASSLLRCSPPPPDLPRACYYGIGGLSDITLGDKPPAGAFWGDVSARSRSYNSSNSGFYPAAMTMALSSALEREKKAHANTNADPLPHPEQKQQQEEKRAKEAEEQAAAATATTTATAAPPRKRAERRVTWDPMVLAREEASAAIRSHIEGVLEEEEYECRSAYDKAATRKFIERRAESRAERERGGRPVAATAFPPAPRRGAFFGLLARLDKKEWRGYKMWEDPFQFSVPLGLTGNLVPAAWGGGGGGGGCAMGGKGASGTGAPLGPVSNLGDYVRRMTTDMLSCGQSRA